MAADKLKIAIGKYVWSKLKDKPFLYKAVDFYKKVDHKLEKGKAQGKLKALREYYEKCDFPELVENSQWRQYRFILWDETGKKVRDKISDKEKLRKWLLRYLPKAAYCTTSTWLNPVNIGKREEYRKPHFRIGDNIILNHDLIFDIDNSDLEQSRKITIQLIEFMENLNYKVKKIIFTGGKGFHVWFNDFEKIEIANPREREYFYMAHRKEILSKVVNAGILVDPVVTSNTRCIVRVPGTVHWKTGFVASYVTKEQLNKPILELLKEIPRAWPEKKFKQKSGDKSRVWYNITESPDYWKNWSSYNAYFVKNNVQGTKDRYVLFLRFKHIWLDGVIKRLKEIQERFNLTDIYVFGSEVRHRYSAICLKTMQLRRINKIIKVSDSVDKISSSKSSYLQVSNFFNEKGEKIGDDFKFITVIRAFPGVNERNFVSKGHLKLLEKLKVPLSKYPLQHGYEECETFVFRIESGKITERKKAEISENFDSLLV